MSKGHKQKQYSTPWRFYSQNVLCSFNRQGTRNEGPSTLSEIINLGLIELQAVEGQGFGQQCDFYIKQTCAHVMDSTFNKLSHGSLPTLFSLMVGSMTDKS